MDRRTKVTVCWSPASSEHDLQLLHRSLAAFFRVWWIDWQYDVIKERLVSPCCRNHTLSMLIVVDEERRRHDLHRHGTYDLPERLSRPACLPQYIVLGPQWEAANTAQEAYSAV